MRVIQMKMSNLVFDVGVYVVVVLITYLLYKLTPQFIKWKSPEEIEVTYNLLYYLAIGAFVIALLFFILSLTDPTFAQKIINSIF